MTAAKQLEQYLRSSGEWIAKNDLCRLEFKTKNGGLYGADLLSRKLRVLEESHILAVKYVDGHSFYKYIPDYARHLYIPTSLRPQEKVLWQDMEELNRLLNTYGRFAH